MAFLPNSGKMPRCEPGQLALLLLPFYANSCFAAARLLLLQIDALVLVADNGGANLRGSLAQLGLLVSKEAFLGAVGTLRAVRGLIATVQAGVAQGAVATAIAGKLIDHAADLDRLLITVDLPWIAEVFAGEFLAGKNRRQGAHLERRGGMVGRNIVGRVRPLCIAGSGNGTDSQSENPAALHPVVRHKTPLAPILDRSEHESKIGTSTGSTSAQHLNVPLATN